MKKTIILLVLLVSNSMVTSQTVTEQWIRRYDGNSRDEEATALAVDGARNVYVTGRSSGVGTSNDYLTIKYNSTGDILWVARYNGGSEMSNDMAQALAVDDDGNVYVTGTAGEDYATIKYNKNGDTLWVRAYNGSLNGLDGAAAIALDDTGNVYVTGTIDQTANSLTPNFGTLKYDTNGGLIWARVYDGDGRFDRANAIAIDRVGNVYVTGRSDSTGAGANYATVKYNPDGVELWARHLDRTGNDESIAIAVDGDGHAYVTGQSAGFTTVKYDSTGNQQWLMVYGGNTVGDMAFDGTYVYVAGRNGGSIVVIKYDAVDGREIWQEPASFNPPGTVLPAVNAISVDKTGGIYVTSRANNSQDYVTVKFNESGSKSWDVSYNGGNGTDEAVGIAVDDSGSVYVTGTSRGDATENDYVTIKYHQSVSNDTLACWLAETFEGLTLGCIDGHNDWHTVPGRVCAKVIANPFGPGNVMLMDSGPNETINTGRKVNVQSSGVHSVSLDVLVDGNPDPDEPTLAKLEIRTTGNAGWDKKFQLYFGAHMRLNYGPTRQDALQFLTANDLVKQRWYHVEAVVDLSTNLVDIFLDGVLKLDNILVGPGAITDISVSAWDRPARVIYDNLKFCRLDARQEGECPVTSFFDVDTEGWMVIEDVQDPIHFQTGGNPGGYISATDIGTGKRWFWQAPAKFLGNLSCAYDKALNFDLRHIANNHGGTGEDVKLEGAGLTLVFDTANNPDENWTAYSVSLNESAGWKKDNLNGDPPTQVEMKSVLSSLTGMFIRGEYSPFAGDIGHLDNVILGGSLKDIGPLRFVSHNIVSEEGDGDGRPEAGERIGISIVLVNDGIRPATEVSAILSTSDSDISLGNDLSDWPDVAAGTSAESIASFDFTINPELVEEKLITFRLAISAGTDGSWESTFDLNITPENLPPVLTHTIPDTTLALGDTTVIRDLNAEPAVFNDPDQDLNALTYFTASSDSHKVQAKISGSLLTVVALDTGTARITVMAEDSRGGVAQTSFAVAITPVTSVDTENRMHVITEYRLYQNSPNPFNPGTLIQYEIPKSDNVLVKVYNIAGQEIRTLVDKFQKMGAHQISWEGKDKQGMNVPSGIYIYRLQSGSFVQNRKMTLLR